MTFSCRWCPQQFTLQKSLSRHERTLHEVEFQRALKRGNLRPFFGVYHVCCLCVSTQPDTIAQHEATPSHISLASVGVEKQSHPLVQASSKSSFSLEQHEEDDFGDLGGGDGGGGGGSGGGGGGIEFPG